MAKIYHYTSIDTLALILKKKSIRFNRLDYLNDLEEGEISSNGVQLGSFGFVSCWTESSAESIPLWKLYTDNGIGVRIALEQDMFKDYYNDDIVNINGIQFNAKKSDMKITKTPLEDLFNSNYIVFPLRPSEIVLPTFYKKVIYVDNVSTMTENSVRRIKEGNGYNRIIINHENIGKYKHKQWSFEQETRFFLFILPSKKFKSSEDVVKSYEQWLYDVWTQNKKNIISEYYMKLKDNIFDDMEIMMSPNCSESKKIIVESLCKEFAPKATISESRLKVKLR